MPANRITALHRFWKGGSIFGVSLVIVGILACYLEDSSLGPKFDFLTDHFDQVVEGMSIGCLCCFICLIGWTVFLNRRQATQLSATVFLLPLLAVLISCATTGFNFHGAAALIFLLTPPATLLSLVLLIMSAYKA